MGCLNGFEVFRWCEIRILQDLEKYIALNAKLTKSDIIEIVKKVVNNEIKWLIVNKELPLIH